MSGEVNMDGLQRAVDAACAEMDRLRGENSILRAQRLALLEALKVIESCLAPEDNDSAAQKVRRAIAYAEGR